MKQTHNCEQTNYQCVVIRYIENKWVTGWFGVEWEVHHIDLHLLSLFRNVEALSVVANQTY